MLVDAYRGIMNELFIKVKFMRIHTVKLYVQDAKMYSNPYNKIVVFVKGVTEKNGKEGPTCFHITLG